MLKRRLLSLVIVLLLCLLFIPSTALAAEIVPQISIQIPGCDAVFTLENVNSEYVIIRNNEARDVGGVYTKFDNLPEYRISFPGSEGKLTCDRAADTEIGITWLDPGETKAGMGGGESSEPEAGWSVSYNKTLDGKGYIDRSVMIFNDGTLVSNNSNTVVALLSFRFGYPVPDMYGTLPDDLISWEWEDAVVFGRVLADLPKHPITELATTETPTGVTPSPDQTTQEVTVIIDGKTLAFDVPPQIINDRTMVPLRAIFEEMGAAIVWDDATRTVTATKDGTVVKLTIGDVAPTVNGVVVALDQPGIIVDGRTLAPLRFVAEAFGGTVEWDGTTRTATIRT